MFSEIESKISYSFKDKKLLEEALTHPSVKRFTKNNFSYQRFEFLGDKVLSFVIAERLFLQFKDDDEGKISKKHASLVCGDSCALVAKKLDLGKFIILSENQETDGGRENVNILENALEAVIGAIYLDGSMADAKSFVLSSFQCLFEDMNDLKAKDPKSTLQEWFQKKYKDLPKYTLVNESQDGFEAEVIIENIAFRGKGRSIKLAEKMAAEKALKTIKFLN